MRDSHEERPCAYGEGMFSRTRGWSPVGSRRRRTRGALLLVVGLALAALAGAVLVSRLSSPAEPENTLLVSSQADIAQARAQLDELPLIERPPAATDYRRAAFGRAWQDVDGNGCNQRDDVLLRDLLRDRPYTVGRQGSCDHDVLAGTWVDPYTGSEIVLTDAKQQRQAQSVQIDHLVPLLVAWRYGAQAWTDDQRVHFANDLTNLVAAGGAANQAKGGADVVQWRPVRAAWCGYAVRYTTVKRTYGLATDRSEKQALATMLATCP